MHTRKITEIRILSKIRRLLVTTVQIEIIRATHIFSRDTYQTALLEAKGFRSPFPDVGKALEPFLYFNALFIAENIRAFPSERDLISVSCGTIIWIANDVDGVLRYLLMLVRWLALAGRFRRWLRLSSGRLLRWLDQDDFMCWLALAM